MSNGIDIVTGGTDSHMILVDLRSKGVTGKDTEESLERAGMTCNKNGVANDPNPPTITSGIRLGSPAATTRGFKEDEFKFIGEKISMVINSLSSSNSDISMIENSIKKEVFELCSKFPIYQ
jgi:glycine hydroxymethyltransferase